MHEYTWIAANSRLPEWTLVRAGCQLARILTGFYYPHRNSYQSLSWILIAGSRTCRGKTTKNLQRELNRLFAGEPIPPCPREARPRVRWIAGTLVWKGRRWDNTNNSGYWVHDAPGIFVGAPIGFRLVEEIT